jgi:transposase
VKAPLSTRLPICGDVNPGLGGRAGPCASSAPGSLAAPTTGPSVPPTAKVRTHVQEGVETRARIRQTIEEGTKTMPTEPTGSTTPNYLRPCVSLDVHKGSITATRMDPGGRVARTWTVPTTRSDVRALADAIPSAVPVVLEASTAGKAVAMVLSNAGLELHMAAPNKIPKPAVKTDVRDSVRLGHLYQSGSMPECYVPPPEIEHLRLLTRNRRDLAQKVTLVKNQVRALVTRNLLDSDMKGVSNWFGISGLRQLVRLPLPAEDRAHLARYLEQLELLAQQEESMQVEMAQVARERPEIQLLMTIPGVSFYAAVGILAEIGDIRRFPDKQHLSSYAGLVPRADNSGDHVALRLPVKRGNAVLKSFLCTSLKAMLKANQETAVSQFYREKARTRPPMLAQVAAARKLSGEVWRILTFGVPYREQDAGLSDRKDRRMRKIAAAPIPIVSAESLDSLADRLVGKTEVLDRLEEETGLTDSDREVELDD